MFFCFSFVLHPHCTIASETTLTIWFGSSWTWFQVCRLRGAQEISGRTDLLRTNYKLFLDAKKSGTYIITPNAKHILPKKHACAKQERLEVLRTFEVHWSSWQPVAQCMWHVASSWAAVDHGWYQFHRSWELSEAEWSWANLESKLKLSELHKKWLEQFSLQCGEHILWWYNMIHVLFT